MKLSNRLLACASLVRPGELVADVGTDHGHLPVYLLEQGICTHVIAGDLREGPLSAAKASAALAGGAYHLLPVGRAEKHPHGRRGYGDLCRDGGRYHPGHSL